MPKTIDGVELEEVYRRDLPIEREEHIAELAGCSVEKAREWLYNDWPEGKEHYDWLHSATDEEIARWLADGVRGEEE